MIWADLDLGLLLHLEDGYGSSSHCDLLGRGANRLQQVPAIEKDVQCGFQKASNEGGRKYFPG